METLCFHSACRLPAQPGPGRPGPSPAPWGPRGAPPLAPCLCCTRLTWLPPARLRGRVVGEDSSLSGLLCLNDATGCSPQSSARVVLQHLKMFSISLLVPHCVFGDRAQGLVEWPCLLCIQRTGLPPRLQLSCHDLLCPQVEGRGAGRGAESPGGEQEAAGDPA